MNVVGYIRYSSENQRDGYSVEAQKRASRSLPLIVLKINYLLQQLQLLELHFC